MENAQFTQLVAEAGPLDDKILEITELAEEGAGWVARFEQIDVRIENLTQSKKIGFSVAFDGPTEDQAAEFFRAMLAANALWRDNGGLRFALGSDDNLIELSIELPILEVTARDIAIYCRGLAEHAATWMLILHGQVDIENEPELSPDFNSDFMRL